MNEPVVVGIDGSPDATRAVAWAAAEADRRGVPLQIVHAWVPPPYLMPLGEPHTAPVESDLREEVELTLSEAAAAATEACPDLKVETDVFIGHAARSLVTASRRAGLLVVGNRGAGGFSGLLLGSVGISVASHAECPVVVVRGVAERTGPVVVGVDGPQRSRDTIEVAFTTAARLDTWVVALHAFSVAPRHRGFADRVAMTSGSVEGYRDHLVAAEEDARRLVETEIAAARELFPEVPVELRHCDGTPAHELVVASQTARIVVVGSRGTGGFAGLSLGSTSHALIHHAYCPVMIFR